ncbi:helicase-related protein [Actinomadura violacea]|uniref:Helicase C-terminal domain-containing protein n=1 Tax=Actinomadura violacea TaxID=2819934 RepID=A0ABS3RY86_9ACTN|nr:helicase-related protein [Actinomadura violacea]MBO2461720.1 hypothetical protein [Actinomadura violacea]
MSLELARACAEALETIKDLDGEPSVAQLDKLRGWAGWGPLAPALEKRADGSWAELGKRVKGLLNRSEEIHATMATATAFYTVEPVARAMWSLMMKLGFDGDRILDPGCGTMVHADTMPPGVDARFTGVEMDPVTAAIAQILHPGHTVINAPLQQAALRLGGFHAAMGNVPFAKVTIEDPTWPADAGFTPTLHNYFIWRAIQAVAPGGLICLITSRFTMDAETEAHREFFARDASFIGAIRFPTKMFAAAGTDVVCDLLVLRRHTGDETPEQLAERRDAWLKSRARRDLVTDPSYKPTWTNLYWDENPHMVLGEIRDRAAAQFGHSIEVVPPDGAAPAALLERSVNALAEDAHRLGLLYSPDTDPGMPDAEMLAAMPREGAHTLHPDGTVTRIEDGKPAKVRASAELKQLILLRDAALELFDAEGDSSTPDEQIRPLREHCRSLYTQYVTAFGPLNRSAIRNGKPDPETALPTIVRVAPSLGGIRIDPDWPTLSAIEAWDDDTETARPAAILLRRVNKPVNRKTSTDSPAEAVALCQDELGRFDLTRAADLLGCQTLTEAAERLSGLVWQDPATLEWVAGDEYLSGDVRVKLAQAEQAAAGDPHRWGGNVAALREVQPDDLGPAEIMVKLGAPWLPTDDIALFIRELLGLKEQYAPTVRHEPFTATWEVKPARGTRDIAAAYSVWGTRRYDAFELISQALNSAAPAVYDKKTVKDPKTGDRKEVRVRNDEETQLADSKRSAIQDRFVQWLWSDPARTDRLVDTYNRLYNAVRLRVWDGSGFTFPGMVGLNPYAHQRDFIARIIGTKNAATLCGYGVGAGKTLIMVAAAMKMRELGLVRKPVVIVPNHLLEQVAGDARRLYPGARVLMVTKKDLTRDRRMAFAAKVAANDWDVIVMTHTQFMALPVSPQVEAEYLEQKIFEYETAMNAAEAADEESRAVKRMGKAIIQLKERHRALMRARRDGGLYFDKLGIDFLFVDEAHFFKNLAAPTSMEGFSMPGSKRAEDLHMKVEWLRAHTHDGRCAALFTGTPITNSLAEAYTLLRYLNPELLHAKKLDSFDAFAGWCVVYETQIEVSPDGSGFRMYRRPRRFQNVPELRLLLGENADIRSRKKLGLKGPKVRRIVEEVVPPSELAAIVESLVRRADAIRSGGVKPDEDNMLAVCTEGRLAALDVRLVGVRPSGPGKAEAVAKNVGKVYRDNRNQLYPSIDDDGTLWMDRPGSFQLVFCDMGTPGADKGTQMYGWMKTAMVAAGVPADEIRYIHEATSDLERKQLFAACRDGRISVLIASTEKAGTGVNVQHRLAAIHHVDFTWRPDEMEQRDGRGDRPGNHNDTLLIFLYPAIGSFDPYMLQGLERKMRMIDQLTDGDPSVREIIDVPSEQEQQYALLKAVSTGQERVMELEQLRSDLVRLRMLETGWSREQTRLRNDAARLHGNASDAERNAAHLAAIAEAAGDPVLKLFNRTIADADQVAEYVGDVARDVVADKTDKETGTWRGIRVKIRYSYCDLNPAPGFALAAPDRYMAPVVFPPVKNGHRPSRQKKLLAAIEQAIAGAAAGADAERQRADYLRQQAEELAPLMGHKFEQQAELDRVTAAFERLEAEIEAEATQAVAKKALPVAA